MYVVVEAWTPEPEFLAASAEERAEFFAAHQSRMDSSGPGRARDGIETLGWGRTHPAGERGVEHSWFAVRRVPDTAAADRLLDGVAASGWYDYCEQTEMRGELRPVGDVIDEHLRMR